MRIVAELPEAMPMGSSESLWNDLDGVGFGSSTFRSEGWCSLLAMSDEKKVGHARKKSQNTWEDCGPESQGESSFSSLNDLLAIEQASSPSHSGRDMMQDVPNSIIKAQQRAALDFVLELTGPPVLASPQAIKSCVSDAAVFVDEIPVPTFAVDRDMQCTMWNKRMAELTGWTKEDAFSSDTYVPRLFAAVEGSSETRSCDELFRCAFYGRDVAAAPFNLKTKSRGTIQVQLHANVRTNEAGAVVGVMCAVAPTCLNLPGAYASEDTFKNHFRRQNRVNDNNNDSRKGSCEILSGGFNEANVSGDGCMREGTSPPPFSILHCGSASSFLSNESCMSMEGEMSGEQAAKTSGNRVFSASARALVVDSVSALRNEMASYLERCGLDVVCASSLQEATWRFGESQKIPSEGPPFCVVFIELQASEDGYNVVQRMRSFEQARVQAIEMGKESGTECGAAGEEGIKVGDPATIVAVVNMNRWDLAGMDICMEKWVAAGVDAVIPRGVNMQQLRVTLRKLGVHGRYIHIPSPLPRALSGDVHNPLNLSR